jgi:uncharacterized protein (DUF488 family)
MRKRECQYCFEKEATFIYVINESAIRFICLDCIHKLEHTKSSVNNAEKEVEEILDRHM